MRHLQLKVSVLLLVYRNTATYQEENPVDLPIAVFTGLYERFRTPRPDGKTTIHSASQNVRLTSGPSPPSVCLRLRGRSLIQRTYRQTMI